MADEAGSATTLIGTTEIAPRRGRVRLGPIEGSTTAETYEVDLELSRSDERLTLGDLRRAALAHENLPEYAHRLWAAVAVAAASVDAPALERLARERVCAWVSGGGVDGGTVDGGTVDGSTVDGGRVDDIAENFRRSNVRYDYLAIAADRALGRSAAQTAATHGCSISTVGRAVEFVAQRDDLLGRDPAFASRIDLAADPAVSAVALGIDDNVMRWILGLRLDRRTQ
jgi:hypothetical protein